MRYYLERTLTVPFSYCGTNTKMSVYGIINYSQNILTDFFKTIDTDNFTLKKKSNAAWVMAKSKTIFFKSLPYWGDEIKVKSFCAKRSTANILIVNEYRNDKDELLVSDIKQMCPIDLATRRIRMLKTISIKNDLESIETEYDIEFNMFKDELNENDLSYKALVRYSDLDGTLHVNNAIYARYIEDCLGMEFLDKDIIKELDIYYLGETRLGETLSVYLKNEDGKYLVEIRNDSKVAIKSIISY